MSKTVSALNILGCISSLIINGCSVAYHETSAARETIALHSQIQKWLFFWLIPCKSITRPYLSMWIKSISKENIKHILTIYAKLNEIKWKIVIKKWRTIALKRFLKVELSKICTQNIIQFSWYCIFWCITLIDTKIISKHSISK